MNSDLIQLWRYCLGSGQRNHSKTLMSHDAENVIPIGIRYDSKPKWVFENLIVESISVNNLLSVLPQSKFELIDDINLSFNEYLLDKEKSVSDERFEVYLIEFCNWHKEMVPKKSDILRAIESGLIHEFLLLERVTLIIINDEPASLFEFRCPVEEYLNEYGFCFIKREKSVEFIIQEISWDLRISNGGIC